MNQIKIQLLNEETIQGVADFLREEYMFPDIFVFSATERDKTLGVLAGRISSNRLEILELNDNAQFNEAVWGALLKAAECYARMENVESLTYQYFGLDEQLVFMNRLLIKNGWNQSQMQWRLIKINTPTKDLHERSKSYDVAGAVVPLLDLPVETRVLFLESHGESYRFTDFDRIVREFSLAYVENEKILGYAIFIQNGDMVELVQSLLPEGREEKVVLISKLAEAYSHYNLTSFVVRVNSEYKGQISEGLFKNQICWRGAQMCTEKKF